MKSNLISAIAGWKSAALLALVAMVAAVAFSGVLSTTQTAQAATIDFAADDTDNAVQAAPGDTVNVAVASAFATVTITGTAEGVSGSFVSGGGQSIQCGDNAPCDVDNSATPPAARVNVDGAVSVALKIDADSGEGHILLSVGGLGTAAVTKVINVSKATLVGSLAIKAASSTIAANDDDTTVGNVGPNRTLITVNVKNAATTPAGLNTQSVTLVTTLGSISCDGTAYAQACSVVTADSVPGTTPGIASDATAEPGWATVTLVGAGVEGKATITARLGTRTATATVTMYGTAKNLTAEPQQGSVEIGGSTFIVLTVTDDAGNPVSGQVITPVTAKEVVGPAKDAVPVTTSKDTTATDPADGSGYNVDFIHATDPKQNLPACGDDKDPVTEAGATPPTTEDFATNGTNDAGKCVVKVNTQKAEGTTKATARGEHTLNFQVSAAVKASATIEVAGAPDSITTSAPETVDPGSVTEITVSVFDDEGILVGITTVKTRKVDGGGLIENEGDDGTEKTVNGQSKFTFIAPTNPGSSEILITAGKINHRVAINIGEPPAPEPEGPPPTWSEPLASGTHNLVWHGEDGADPSDGAGEGVTAIWQWDGSSWNGYFPNAADVPGGNTLSSLTNGAAYWVIVE